MKFGGNLVTNLGPYIDQTHQFCDDLYSYSILVLKQNEIYKISHLDSARVFLLEGKVKINDLELSSAEDSVQIENLQAEVRGESTVAKILLVGSKSSAASSQQLQLISSSALKKVEKPWGYEIWITGEHPQYCLKKIFIKKGTKTSLQYHEQKRETNVLFEGTARLHFKKEDSVKIQELQGADIGSCDLQNVSVIDVFPLTIHRLEAVSDILLFEASTPHLDDVVRISDDTNRGHGRIQSEHDKK